jgi:hypothetical protein
MPYIHFEAGKPAQEPDVNRGGIRFSLPPLIDVLSFYVKTLDDIDSGGY